MKILLIRFLAIGDVVLTSSLCSTLRKSFPDAQIDYLMHAASAPLFELHPHIDQVITLSQAERKNPVKYLRKAWRISRARYDIIIDATSTEKSQIISLMSPSSEFRIGRTKGRKGFAYTHKLLRENFTGNKVAQRMMLLEPLKQAGYDIQEVRTLHLSFSDAEINILKTRMLEQGLDFSRPIFAFSVSSKLEEKKWRLDYMTEAIKHCIGSYRAQIVVFGGMPHERPDQETVFNNLQRHSDVFINIDSTSLRELGALLCLCDIYIGNEGGPRHIAEAVGLPSATVFSPKSRVDEWLPNRGPHHQAIEWQDVVENNGDAPVYGYGDETYFRLYNSIKPKHFTAIIDSVIDSSQVLESHQLRKQSNDDN